MYFKISCVVFMLAKQILMEGCYTPENQEGQCVPLHACAKVLKAFANPPKGSETYLRQFICSDEQEIKVCCGISTNFTVMAEQHSMYDPLGGYTEILVRHAIPDCSTEKLSDAILPVIFAQTADFDVEFAKCLGALLNPRYVLTLAQCVVVDNRLQEFEVVGVQFPLREKDGYFIGIEEKIPHPFYDPTTGVNNLALLRLDSTVDDKITPLCMYKLWPNDFVKPGEQLTTFGGLRPPSVEQWPNKTLLSTRFVSSKMCNEKLHNKNVNVVVTEYEICMEDFKNTTKVTCNAYAGVPSFYLDSFLVGISSLKTGCEDGLPDVYINVLAYRQWIINNMRPWLTNNEQCTTPNGEIGQCQSIFYCSALLKMFSDVRNSTEVYLHQLICKEGDYLDEFSVCCPISSNITTLENKKFMHDMSSQLLESELCGIQHRDDYFSSSLGVAIDEFPWIALIQWKDDEKYYGTCTGTLINARYVLTTARCAIVEAIETIVRLGDYNQLNETDCVKDIDVDETDCTETEKFGVEDTIIHPFYIKLFNFNDIALLRLNRTVLYSDFVRPICLPVQGTTTAKPGESLYLSSWGVQDNESKKGVKRKVLAQLITNSQCQKTFQKNTYQDLISVSTMCTIYYKNTTEFATTLDGGGALMSHNDYRWHIEGLLFGFVTDFDLPVQYINVSEYVNWILENMRPW